MFPPVIYYLSSIGGVIGRHITSQHTLDIVRRSYSSKYPARRHNPSSTRMSDAYTHLTQDEAINLDKDLFNEYSFSVDQLMELAGLSVATAIARTYPKSEYDKPVICCGPGNNGGDGLVCARHLKMFGYSPVVICPKPGRGQLFENLLTQCAKYEIQMINQVPSVETLGAYGNVLVDAVFGFSFKPPNRNPDFSKLLHMINATSLAGVPLVSVDIPSGWHVEKGDTNIEEQQAEIGDELKIPALKPDCLVSLTAPKLGAKHFKGRYHYLGGRFCPQSLKEKYRLNLPEYPGQDQIVLIGQQVGEQRGN